MDFVGAGQQCTPTRMQQLAQEPSSEPHVGHSMLLLGQLKLPHQPQAEPASVPQLCSQQGQPLPSCDHASKSLQHAWVAASAQPRSAPVSAVMCNSTRR